MKKHPFKTSTGIITFITNLQNGNLGIEVLDTDSHVNLTKIVNPFEFTLNEGDPVEINYNIIGEEKNGELSGTLDFDLSAIALDEEPVAFSKIGIR